MCKTGADFTEYKQHMAKKEKIMGKKRKESLLKRIWCMVLSLSLVLSYVSPTIYAGPMEAELPHIVLNMTPSDAQEPEIPTDQITNEDMIDEDDIDGDDINIEETPSDALATPPNAKKYTVEEVREMIDALPDAEELKNLSHEEQIEVYGAAQEAWDAFETLDAEEQEQLAAEKEKLDAIMGYFSEWLETVYLGSEICRGFQIEVGRIGESSDGSINPTSVVIDSITYDDSGMKYINLTVPIEYYLNGTLKSGTLKIQFTKYKKGDGGTYDSVDMCRISKDTLKSTIVYHTSTNIREKIYGTNEYADVYVHRYAGHAVESWTPNGSDKHTGECLFHGDVSVSCDYTDDGICTVCGGFQSADWNEDLNAYEIGNIGQLKWYGQNASAKNAVLVKDINIGTEDSPYVDWSPIAFGSQTDKPVFDGQGHTITMYLTQSNVGGTAAIGTVGLFNAGYGTIRNMVLKGSLHCNVSGSGNGTAGSSLGRVGVVSPSGYGVTFENIVSYVDVTNDSAAPTGGIVGYLGGAGATINNCAVYADISGSSQVGGLVGAGWNGNQSWKILNSTYSGTLSGAEGKTGALMGYSETDGGTSSSSIKNSYYPDTIASSVGGADRPGTLETVNSSTTKTADQYASGEVTYLLNGGNTSNPVWRQTCGEGLPVQSGKVVYALAGTDATLYTNDSDLIQKNTDGYYEIYRNNQLMMFADFVNAGNKNVNAILMADLDMSGYAWPTIASTGLYYSDAYSSGNYPDAGYGGTFDGNCHEIKNLSVTSVSGANATYGLFGSLSGTVRRLGINGFTYTHKAKDMRTAAIAGQNLGGRIEDCYVVNATITPGTNVTAGIAASNYAGTIENCHVFNSSITGTKDRYGWIVADNRADTAGDRAGTIINCYTDGTCVVGSYTGTEDTCAVKTKAEFSSGEVTSLLNHQYAQTGLWKQTMGSDSYPNFTGQNLYYKSSKGFNAVKPQKTSGIYQITSEEEMAGFAELVNGGETKANAIMRGYVSMGGILDFHIGTEEHPYAGTFDGNLEDYTVNLEGDAYLAPFRYVNGATIKNLITWGYIDATGKYAGGIISCVTGGTVTLECCLSRVRITSEVDGDGTHGGLIGLVMSGSTLKINNCGFNGGIYGQTTHSCGGLVGWIDGGATAAISNSYVAVYYGLTLDTSHTDDSTNTFIRNPGRATLKNCYYLDNWKSVPSGAVQKTEEQFYSGEVTWLLNEEKASGVWKQYVGKGREKFPTFDADTVYNMGELYMNWEPPEQNAEGIYEIYTSDHLYAFSAYVNAGHYSADAKVMNDLDMYREGFTPIARTEMSESISYGYTGTFDGQGHTIETIKLRNDLGINSTHGLFGTIYAGGVVKNVGVKDLRFDDDANDHRAGGIAGQLMAGGLIENCFVTDSTIKASSRVVGGIAAMNRGTIRNCYTKNLDMAAHSNRYGGICGDFPSGRVENCYTDYSAIGSTGNHQGTIVTSECSIGDDRFASGEIAYRLNGDQSTIVWYQTCGEDLPAFSGEQVYYGYLTCTDTEMTYSNEAVTSELPHQYTGAPKFQWAEDYTGCKAVFSCTVDSTHEQKLMDCAIDVTISDTGKYKYYTATVTLNDKTYTDTQKILNVVISMDIQWSSMEFIYEKGSWDPEEHTRADGAWEAGTSDGGTISLQNNGNVGVNVSFGYDTNITGISGEFENEKLILETEESGSTAFKPNGKPTRSLDKTRMGNITVNITKRKDAFLDLSEFTTDQWAEEIRKYLADGSTELAVKLGKTELTTTEVNAILAGINAAELDQFSLTVEDVTSVQGSAFKACKKLTAIHCPKATEVRTYAFSQCTNLKEIDFPEVKTVSYNAFEGCKSLEKVSMPKATKLGDTSFMGCTSLKEISLPSMYQLMGYVFWNCTSLTTVNMPKLEIMFGSNFYGCTSLECMDFPKLMHMEGNEFYGCSSLKEISVGAELLIMKNKVFDGITTSEITLSLNPKQASGSTTYKAVFGENGTFYSCTFKEIKEYGQ